MSSSPAPTMPVNLRIHGGEQGLLNVLEGLVRRNERAIREGKVPHPGELPLGRVRHDPRPVWKDAISALTTGAASVGTLAAWAAAGERTRGKSGAKLAVSGGIPVVFIPGEAPTVPGVPVQDQGGPTGLVRVSAAGLCRISAPSTAPLFLPPDTPLQAGPGRLVSILGGREPVYPGNAHRALQDYGAVAVANPLRAALSPGYTAPNGTLILPSSFPGFGGVSASGLGGSSPSGPTGRVSEWLLLTLDDDEALPIREIGDAIAQHNARQVLASLGTSDEIPDLYASGVRYKIEGLPEIWKDNRETIKDGFDDCEGFAAYRAGDLMARYNIPAWVWTREIKGPPAMGMSGQGRMFHAITRAEIDGKEVFDDPSRRLGMDVPDFYLEYARQQRSAGRPL